MNIDPNFASFVAQFIGTVWSIFVGKTISEMVMECRIRRKTRSSSSHSGRQGKRVGILMRAAFMLILTCIAIILYNSGVVSINLPSDKSAKIQNTAVQSTPPIRFHSRRSWHRKGSAASSSSTLTATPAPSPTQVLPTTTSVVTPASSPSPTQVPPTATSVVIPTLSPTPPAATPTLAPTPTVQGL
jgi:hypothetical protein